MNSLQRPSPQELADLTARVLKGAELVAYPGIFRKSIYEAGSVQLPPAPVEHVILLLELDATETWEADVVPPEQEDPELAAVYFLFHDEQDEGYAMHAAEWLREQLQSDEERVWCVNGIVRNGIARLDVNPIPADERLGAAGTLLAWDNARGWFLPA